MRKKILGVAVAACMALPAAGGAIPTAAAGEVTEFTKVDIVAMDYHFMLADGSEFPKELKKGEYKFTFENQSEKRMHEVAMFKLRHGKTIKQLLNMPQKKVERHIRVIGGSFAEPGETGKAFKAKLITGRYAMLCFVQNSKKSAPHFAKGMLHRFNVVL